MRNRRQSANIDQTMISARDAEIQLLHLLTGARTIAHFTVEDLSRMYRVRPGKIAQMLATEQERRSRLL
ncbi:hypothetical protein SLG_21910 [Sphingobium sp. SYK-6]|nr:hypothetical protein SLG_21910 [Sphingobium sp. SYK-6]